jgi:hypothetical protein
MNNDFDDYFAELEEKTKRQIAAEDAAWLALPQADKERILASKTHDIPDGEECCEECDSLLSECECEDSDD